MDRTKAIASLGIIEGGVIISPPVCTECGSFCVIAVMDDSYIQCESCGHIKNIYVYKDTMFKRKEVPEDEL